MLLGWKCVGKMKGLSLSLRWYFNKSISSTTSPILQGRALLCKWLVDDLQYTQVSVAEKLSITRAVVGVLANRG